MGGIFSRCSGDAIGDAISDAEEDTIGVAVSSSARTGPNSILLLSVVGVDMDHVMVQETMGALIWNVQFRQNAEFKIKFENASFSVLFFSDV